MKNKKAQIGGVVLLILALAVIVFLGVLLAIGSSVLNLVMDVAEPEFTSLGMVGETNMSEISTYTITPVNTFVQNFTWVAGVFYVLSIIIVFGIAFIYRSSGSKWLVGLFFALIVILVIICIFMSNVYEAFYSGTDEIAVRLKEHVLLSFLILYSPAIMTLIAFISGIILFSGQEEFV